MSGKRGGEAVPTGERRREPVAVQRAGESLADLATAEQSSVERTRKEKNLGKNG